VHATEPPARRDVLPFALALLFLSLLILPAPGLAPAVRAQPASGDGPPPVPVVRPEQQELVEFDEFTGRFEAFQRTEVRARVSGYLERVAFQEGQRVEKGALLFVIDPRPYRIAVQAAEASLDEARAQRDLARIEADRARTLIRSNAIPQDELDLAVQRERSAAAAVARSEASLAQARLELEYTEVRAPIAGRVGSRRLDVGNLVSGGAPGADVLTTLIQEDPIYFAFEASETDFLRYARLDRSGERPGSRTTPNAVSVRLLDEDDFEHHGVMDFVDNELDPTSGTIVGRAVFANPDGFLQPGLFGRLRLQGSGLYEAVLVPDEVIQFDQSRRFVYVVDGDDTIARRFVEPGPLHEGLRVIRSGLEADARVVSGAWHRVRVGQRVAPRPASAAGSGDGAGGAEGDTP
jgi:RND family efflux transporter MFP subunit